MSEEPRVPFYPIAQGILGGGAESPGAQADLGVSIDATLTERGKRYGEFSGHARITQELKRAMIGSGRWDNLSDSQREALEMIAHKIGRILNGDPNYHDSWHDIVGYAKLVADELTP